MGIAAHHHHSRRRVQRTSSVPIVALMKGVTTLELLWESHKCAGRGFLMIQ